MQADIYHGSALDEALARAGLLSTLQLLAAHAQSPTDHHVSTDGTNQMRYPTATATANATARTKAHNAANEAHSRANRRRTRGHGGASNNNATANSLVFGELAGLRAERGDRADGTQHLRGDAAGLAVGLLCARRAQQTQQVSLNGLSFAGQQQLSERGQRKCSSKRDPHDHTQTRSAKHAQRDDAAMRKPTRRKGHLEAEPGCGW